MSLIDNTIALRVIYLLVSPIEKSDAFKLGLISSKGETLRKAKTAQEKNATSMLHRLCWKIKRVFSLVPGGSTKLGSLAAAYLLVREAEEKGLSDEDAEKFFEEAFSKDIALKESAENLDLIETILEVVNSENRLLDEDGEVSAPSVTTASLGGTVSLPIGKPLRRQKKSSKAKE